MRPLLLAATKHSNKFLDLFTPVIDIASGQGMIHTRCDMVIQDNGLEADKRGLHSLHLTNDINTIPIVGHHLRDAAHLSPMRASLRVAASLVSIFMANTPYRVYIWGPREAISSLFMRQKRKVQPKMD